MNYGDGLSFARFKRPAPSNYQHSPVKPSFAYDSEYKERYPVYSSRTNRHSSHSIRKNSREQEHRGIHQKTNSQGNLVAKNIIATKTYDETQPPYQNSADYDSSVVKNEHISVSQTPAQNEMPPRSGHRRNSTYDYSRDHPPRGNLNHTISYEDHNNNVLPSVNKPKQSDSPKISKSYTNLRGKPKNRLYDSLDQHVTSNSKL